LNSPPEAEEKNKLSLVGGVKRTAMNYLFFSFSSSARGEQVTGLGRLFDSFIYLLNESWMDGWMDGWGKKGPLFCSISSEPVKRKLLTFKLTRWF